MSVKPSFRCNGCNRPLKYEATLCRKCAGPDNVSDWTYLNKPGNHVWSDTEASPGKPRRWGG